MSLRRVIAGGLLLIPLAGCGSQSYPDAASSAIGSFRDTIAAYNSAHPTDLASTASTCANALSSLDGASDLSTRTPTARYRKVGAVLASAYGIARAGFADCETGARRADYTLMARADEELATANTYIRQAQALDH